MSLNVLLTGGAGYIGSHVVNLLIEKGYSVTVVDNLITGNKKLISSSAEFEKCDISNVKKISRILKKKKFDIAMHFAGLVSVDESLTNPKKYIKYNYEKTKIFFNTCLKNGLKKIIFSSTASVYGNPNKYKVSERAKLNPQNPYAISKQKAEKYIIDQSKKFSLKYIILRYFNVAGADEKLRTGLISKQSTHLIKRICEVVTKKKKKLIINGNDYDTIDGTPVRDYIHVSDLADVHLLTVQELLNGGKSNIFNCGYGRGYSVKQVVDTLNKILNYKIPVEIGLRRQSDCEYLVANSDKFSKYFSWKPKYDDLKFILKTSLDWEKKLKKNF